MIWRWLKYLMAFFFEKDPMDGRRIFRFQDGAGTRFVDPIEVYTRMEELYPGWLESLRRIATPPVAGLIGEMRAKDMADRKATAAKLALVSCEAFGVRSLDQGGLTVAERLGLLSSFASYIGGLADRAAPFDGSPKPTEPSPPG